MDKCNGNGQPKGKFCYPFLMLYLKVILLWYDFSSGLFWLIVRLVCSLACIRALACSVLCRKRYDSLPVSMMWQWCVSLIQQGGCHFGIAEHARPFGKSQIGGNDDAGTFV